MTPYRQPVTPEEFEFGLRVSQAASQKRGPYRNPESYPGIPMNDGSGKILSVKDTGLARASFAVIEQFGPEKGGAIMYRTMLLMDMLQLPEMKDYVRDFGNPAMEFHPALIPVAAGFPVTSDGMFDKDSFVKAVRDAAAKLDDTEE